MAPGYALRFISGKYQGGEFPLADEREFVVGRASDLDMVLVEDMVSRRHAKISTFGNQIVITDMDSTNGTFVNGEKIRQTRLKEGDRILIGTSILKLVFSNSSQISPSAAREQLAAVGAAQSHNTGSSMTGTLQEVPVPDLLQLFSTSKRTGVLVIESQLGIGKIYLRSGNIYYASINEDHELGPMKSFCRIVSWEEGAFEFGSSEDSSEFIIELEDPTESLLMEALRQLDEFRRIAPELPAPTDVYGIPQPLQAGLSELSSQELEIFQLVYNLGSMQHVFDRSPTTDYETAETVISLIKRQYLIHLQ